MLKQPKPDQSPSSLKFPSTRTPNPLSLNIVSVLLPLHPKVSKESPLKNVASKRRFRTFSSTQVMSGGPSPAKLSSDDLSGVLVKTEKCSFVEGEAKNSGERHSEQGKHTHIECVKADNRVSGFRDYMQKIELGERQKKQSPTKLIIMQDNTLKSALREPRNGLKPKAKLSKLNLAKIDPNFSDTSPEQSPDSGHMSNGYKHSPCAKFFAFDETVLQKARARESIHKKVKETLKEEDKEIFDMFEKCKQKLMNHSEWFSDSKVQSAVCSMVSEIEQKWIGSCMSSQLKLISCEKEQLEQQLKQKQEELPKYEFDGTVFEDEFTKDNGQCKV
eukprot:TRINITY_DN2780_c0_g1_i5.p1 TRINITY_DN2780_c0_g1~~TRINITY_DN2780_c0_g1_i5.p1  ORF type:complete len:331 (-),score=67.04 TRINITY_DN2780_c0_g1_i5:498-1490(-)